MPRSIAAVLLTALLPVTSVAADPPAPVGSRVADFTLPEAATGKPWSLADHTREAKATVILFVGTGCPVNNAYLPKLARWHDMYGKKGVVFVGINCHEVDDVKAVAAHAKEYAIPFPVLKDDGTKTADRLGVDRIPTAVVLDSGRTVRYFGRIDDQYSPGVQRNEASTREMANAVDAVLANTEVSTPYVEAAGCKLTRDRAVVTSDEPVTYHKHVSRILQEKCQECHRAGEAGPFQLMTYKHAKGWAGMIREVVADGVMPPWHADAPLGHFANDRRLTPEQKKTLLSWVDQGCPEGDVKDAPEPRRFVSGWRLGREPDLVVRMDKPIQVPAQYAFGLAGMPYQYVTAGEPFQEDVWVQATEARPDYRGVIHHIIVFVIPPGKSLREIDGGLLSDGMLATYVPGDLPVIYPEGTARKIAKGSRLLFEVHYTPNGKPGTDRSSVGIVFAKKPPKHEIHGRAVVNSKFAIPPGDPNHEVRAKYTFRKPAVLTMMSPHMHLRGKAFKYELVTPDGKRETLLSVPKYDFNWQASYTLAEPKEIPAGSTIECTAWFDNSKDNPFNPDPDKRVKWGDQTWEEMMIGFLDYRAK